MPETAKRTARVPILGEDGRISDDYIPAAIGEGVESAEAAATRAETAATSAEGSAAAAGQSAAGAQGSASAAGTSATQAQQSAATASGAATQAQSARQAAEAAKTGAESARDSAQTAASQAQQSAASVADKFITSAQATTLEPGSQATASVADQVLTIGVPKGEKGDKGDTGDTGKQGVQGDKGDPGTAATIAVGSVTGLPAGASPTVVNSGTANAAVLDFGIPKGDKGDKGDPGTTPTVVAAEGSDLSVSTDEGTVTIDDSALRARIAELENQAANVVTGTSTGLVSHGEDAFPQKPREVRIKGKTWVNRWPVISGTNSGITASTDETGLITVTGTATADADVTADVSGWATGKSYTTMVSATPTGCSAYFEVQKPSGNTSINATTTGATLNVASDATNCVAGVHVTSGTTVNASFRVMLVDGTEAPDCFTPPASITSAQPEKLVTSGKNLLPVVSQRSDTENGVTFTSNGDGSYTLNGTATVDIYHFTATDTGFKLPPGTYTVSGGIADKVNVTIVKDDRWLMESSSKSGSITTTTPGDCYFYLLVNNGTTLNNVTVYPQLELGSTATDYEPPSITTTPLPEVELRSLPNGTCDELVIKEDGTCEVERNVTEYEVQGTEDMTTGEHSSGQKYVSIMAHLSSSSNSTSMLSDRYVCGTYSTTTDKFAYVPNGVNIIINDSRFTDRETTRQILADEKPIFLAMAAPASAEPQTPVTLPALPAPTFNQYHDADIPSDTSTRYVRDINIVIDNLAKQIAGTAATVAINEATR